MTNPDETKTFDQLLKSQRDAFVQNFQIEGLFVKFVDRTQFRKLLELNYTRVFDSTMTNYSPSEDETNRGRALKSQYLNLHSDYLILTDGSGNYMGHFSGETEDPSTFYLRNAGILPDLRKKGIATNFMDSYLKYLHNLGYSRVTSQHHGTNNAVLIMMLKQGFNICGMEIREEWGILVKCVKFLSSDRMSVFTTVTKGNR
jgi:GNAT superfamily N-acetyltransferase